MSKARDLANAGTALTTVSATELGYLDGVTSAVQTQIDGKQAANANVSTTELGYLDGVTSAIQTQLNAKEPTLPSQTGNSGKYLTTDGTNKSWGSVSAVPASATATVATNQSTTSSGYTDLATAGPSVTLTTGTKALVIVTGWCETASGLSAISYMSFAVSGATTISAVDANAVVFTNISGSQSKSRASAATLVTLTAGSNTFTAKYRNDSNTTYFQDRQITVINLG